MVKDSLTIELTFESDLKRLELIEGLTNLVGRECGLNEDELHGTLMSVHECVINAIRHGNQEDPKKKVRVTFRTAADLLEIKVCDEGPAFDPVSIPDPLEKENILRPSGRGIFLIQAFMDEFSVQNCENRGNEVTMVKRLPSPTKP